MMQVSTLTSFPNRSRSNSPCSYLSGLADSQILFVSRQVFHDIAYKAKNRQDLLAGIEEFLDEVIVLPPGEWDPDIRIEPPKSLPSSDKRSALVHDPST